MNLSESEGIALVRQTTSPRTVLVGGQAIAVWARYFDIQSQVAALTRDVDYLGSAMDAKSASANLTFEHTLKIAGLDDGTPNTAVISIELAGHEDPVLIDYLADVAGPTASEIKRTAIPIQSDGVTLKIIHPLLLLQSKMTNLQRFQSKRTPEGIEQARLAICIAAKYIGTLVAEKAPQREILRAAQSVGRFAATAPAQYAREEFSLDCLLAVPQSVFEKDVLPAKFHEESWPRLVRAVRGARRIGLPDPGR